MFTDFAKEMGDAFRLRHALVPQLYSALGFASEESLAYPVRSLFVDFPELELAMEWSDRQFMYCDNVTVAPVTRPGLVGDFAAAGSTQAPESIRQLMFVPPGEWMEWGGARSHIGPGTATIDLQSTATLPALVKAGSVLFMQPWNATDGGDTMDKATAIIAVLFPSSAWTQDTSALHLAGNTTQLAAGSFRLYEDDSSSPPATMGAPLRARLAHGGPRASCITTVSYQVAWATTDTGGAVTLRGRVGPSIGSACREGARRIEVHVRGASALGIAGSDHQPTIAEDPMCTACTTDGTLIVLNKQVDLMHEFASFDLAL